MLLELLVEVDDLAESLSLLVVSCLYSDLSSKSKSNFVPPQVGCFFLRPVFLSGNAGPFPGTLRADAGSDGGFLRAPCDCPAF